MNQSIAENFMRSAKAPQISAGVMIANVIWNIMKTVSGIVCAMCETLSFGVLQVDHALQEETVEAAEVGSIRA